MINGLNEEIDQKMMQKTERLDKLRLICEECRLCALGPTRIKLVFGDGISDALFMFIGEAPGKDEDRLGLPFVGRSGKLLRSMIQAIDREMLHSKYMQMQTSK